MKIRIHYDIERFKLSESLRTKRIAGKIITDAGRKLGLVDVIFTSDKKLVEINREFLSHNYFTDIITFDYCEGRTVYGEIYISVDSIRENSKSLNVTLRSEVNRVIFHGFLHLCGYNDSSRKEKETMHDMEDMYLALYNAE